MPEVSLVAKSLVINESNQAMLMVRADDDRHRPGEVDLPGGSVDEGETFEAAAVRETREETGLIVNPQDLTLIYTDTRIQDGKSIIRCMFAIRKFSGDVILSEEHSSYSWCDIETMPAMFNESVWSTAIQYALKNKLL